jgi:orotidine-5'-phosphate decarboxylase
VVDGYESMTESESELLDAICRLLSEVELLEDALEIDGVMVAGSTGQRRVHPAVEALRSHRLALGRLLSQLALPDPEGSTLASPVQAQRSNAAKKRWNG